MNSREKLAEQCAKRKAERIGSSRLVAKPKRGSVCPGCGAPKVCKKRNVLKVRDYSCVHDRRAAALVARREEEDDKKRRQYRAVRYLAWFGKYDHRPWVEDIGPFAFDPIAVETRHQILNTFDESGDPYQGPDIDTCRVCGNATAITIYFYWDDHEFKAIEMHEVVYLNTRSGCCNKKWSDEPETFFIKTANTAIASEKKIRKKQSEQFTRSK